MFEFLASIFNTILYQPLFNTLIFLYTTIPGHDFGISIIILTIIIRIILYPLLVKSIRSQKVLQDLQPKIEEIQKKFKNDQEVQTKEIFAIYKKEKINPFSGLFLALLQLPILIALYQVFWHGFDPQQLQNLYSFIRNPGEINHLFLSFIDLSKPNIYIAFIAGITQFFQTKMLFKKNTKKGDAADFSKILQNQTVYMLPLFTIFILWSLPSALGLYWATSSVLSIIQQYVVLKK